MRTRDVLSVNLRREIDAQGEPVGAIASRAGVAVVEIYEVLAGEMSATVDWLERIANALGVTVEQLVRPQDQATAKTRRRTY
jgi:hypothetical protein